MTYIPISDEELLKDYRIRIGIATAAFYDIKNNMSTVKQCKDRAENALRAMDKVIKDSADRRNSTPQKDTAPPKDPREDAMGVPSYLLGDAVGSPSPSGK